MRTLLLVALIGAPMAAWGQEPAAPAPAPAPAPTEPQWGWAFLGTLEFGGDQVATVYFTDGSSQDVKTGQGGTLGIGAHYRASPQSPWGVRSTIGYKFVTTKASNSDIGVTRIVWDLVASHRAGEDSWVGVGLVHHSNIRFDGGGLISDMDFDDALGLRFEIGWRWIALTVTSMDYTDEFGNDYDAGAVGLMLTNAFWTMP